MVEATRGTRQSQSGPAPRPAAGPETPPATTPPPPPGYAPWAGLPTTWWSQTTAAIWTPERVEAGAVAHDRLIQSVDALSRSITETPEERELRLRAEDDAARAAAGETPRQCAQRHRAQGREAQRAVQRATTRVWKVGPDERARRFRRWCTLTALSASAGYAVGLVQWVSTLPLPVAALFALPAAYWLDLRMRGGVRNPVRLTDLRGPVPIGAVLLARVPVASVLASLLGLNQLLALSGQLFQ
jgi:hypothetical protein